VKEEEGMEGREEQKERGGESREDRE